MKMRTIISVAGLVFFVFAVAITAFHLSTSKMVWAAQDVFLADKHKNVGLDCSSCHNGTPPNSKVSMDSCTKCHGDYIKIAEKTISVKPNPHDSHLGNIDCDSCHLGHKPSVDYCQNCHSFGYKVP